MKYTKLGMILVAALLLYGCVSTPDEEMIANRLDGTMEQRIVASAAEPYRYAAPERWEEVINVRGQEIRIDAGISVPDAEMHPVITIKKHSITADQAYALITAALGENLQIREQTVSYEELLLDLLQAQRGRYIGEDEDGAPIYGAYEGQEKEIAEIREQMRNTPVTDTYIPLTQETFPFPCQGCCIKTTDGETWYVRCYPSYFSMFTFRKGGLQPERWLIDDGGYIGDQTRKLENIRISETDAIATAEAFLERFGRSDLKISHAEKARTINEEGPETKEIDEGYVVYVCPALEGTIPFSYRYQEGINEVVDFYQFENETAYAESWSQTNVTFYVTEQGIRGIGWSDDKEPVMTANENVVLMPFKEVQRSIRKLLEYGVYRGSNSAIVVDRIMLITAIEKVPNQEKEAFLIPTWIVFYRTDSVRYDTEESYFLVNALDGLYVSKLGHLGGSQ